MRQSIAEEKLAPAVELDSEVVAFRRRGRTITTTGGRTAVWATRPPPHLRPGVLLPLRLRLRFSSTPGKKKRKP